MDPFSCPYCLEPLTQADMEDRTKTVFWFEVPDDARYAHTVCWLEDEIKPRPHNSQEKYSIRRHENEHWPTGNA
jgi:hypothetical protein